jgi:hypothetical protein
MTRCVATTASGARCKSWAVHGTERCVAHNETPRSWPTMSDEVIDKIVTTIRAGNYLAIAIAAHGVPHSTFYGWWARGEANGTEKRDAPFREMRVRVERARAEGEARNVAVIATAAPNNWQAAAWLLERGSPERWARPSQRGEDSARPSELPAAADPFAEVDELAKKRREHS